MYLHYDLIKNIYWFLDGAVWEDPKYHHFGEEFSLIVYENWTREKNGLMERGSKEATMAGRADGIC